MKRFLLSTVAIAAAMAFAGAANAADIARPAPMAVKAPAYIAPLYSWTGFYIGGNVGYGWGDGSGTLTNPAGAVGGVSGNGDGILGGIQAGYNWQTGPWVWGVEADIQGSGVSGNFNAPTLGVAGSTRTDWFGTIRGRLGYAVNTWMFYVTGGGAWANNRISSPGLGSASATGWTYTVGAGVEAFIAPKWSVKAEYLYFGTPDTVPNLPGFGATGNVDSNLVRVGANYHF